MKVYVANMTADEFLTIGYTPSLEENSSEPYKFNAYIIRAIHIVRLIDPSYEGDGKHFVFETFKRWFVVIQPPYCDKGVWIVASDNSWNFRCNVTLFCENEWDLNYEWETLHPIIVAEKKYQSLFPMATYLHTQV